MNRPINRIRAATLGACLALLAVAPAANAAFGDDFGFAPSEGPALVPGHEKAIWLGGCDLHAASTAGTGVGVAPANPVHCIDSGIPSPLQGVTWVPGQEPSWRLDSASQAGSHADVSVMFWMNRSLERFTGDGDLKTVVAKLPPGVMADPNAVPKCAAENVTSFPNTCPPQTQIGVSRIAVSDGNATIIQNYPVYNVEARDGKLGEIFFSAEPEVNLGGTIPIVAGVETEGDYGITAVATNIPTAYPVLGQMMTLWGVPWAASHDKYRTPSAYRGTVDGGTIEPGIPDGGLAGGSQLYEPTGTVLSQEPQHHDPSWGEIRPFTSLPSECRDTPPVVEVSIDSWQHPGSFITEHAPADAAIDGCGKVPFDPELAAEPTTQSADSPTGLDVELKLPQNDDPPFAKRFNADDDDPSSAIAHWKSDAGLSTSHLRDAVLTLPEGMTVNPAAAAVQEACTSAQIGLLSSDPIRFSNDDPSDGKGNDCPTPSKIGTVTIETPLLDEADWPTGEVYLAAPHDNPFDSLLAIYVAARAPERGLTIKLAGKVEADPATGRLRTVFIDNPQLPFERLRVRLKGGPNAPLVTPPTCGSHASVSELTAWSRPGNPTTISDPFSIASGPNGTACASSLAARPFGLGFDAGTTNPQAGAHTVFTMRLTRPDGAQEIDRLTVKTPEGFVASLRGVPYCSEAQLAVAATKDGRAEQASPSCPAASRIGTIDAGGGAGPNPIYVKGDLFLSGPYGGAPLSLAAIVPAVAGPFDLGAVVVRAALRVDPRTAQITTVTDPLPKILEGIPLRVRDIRVAIDRSVFALNPTDCSEQEVSAHVLGASGASTDVSNRFQVGGCEALGFKPSLSFRLKGGTRRGAHPALTTTLRTRPGDANIGAASVALPGSEFLDQSHIRTVCTRVQFAQNACPQGSIYGYATAESPLLDQPLQGPVYLRSSDNTLPDLVASLSGQISVEVSGRIDSVKGRIRSTFDVVPDAPVTRFTLSMKGGGKGLLVNSKNLCKQVSRAVVKMTAQNGRRHAFNPKLANDCPKAKQAKRSR